VTINLTMIGQMIAFVMFVLFCMRYVWPPLITVMRERQAALAELELEDAKKESADSLAQARSRATQIVEDAKRQAVEEADRIKAGAQAEIDQEVNRAREQLRGRVGELAIEGAEKILEASVDEGVHRDMLNKIASQL
jgi:F-type H+-transporting ATPase subunit b